MLTTIESLVKFDKNGIITLLSILVIREINRHSYGFKEQMRELILISTSGQRSQNAMRGHVSFLFKYHQISIQVKLGTIHTRTTYTYLLFDDHVFYSKWNR